MFITFEGIDGCGKSTQAKMLFELLNKNGGAVLTREPGGWDGGDALRSLVLNGGLRHGWSEFFLFMLDRAEHAARVIEPALAAGRHVICERYHDSTLAYQVWGRGLPYGPLRDALLLAGLPVPDVTFFFSVPPETALSRVSRRGAPDAFEREGLGFMKKIDEGYRTLAKNERSRWVVVECGKRTPEEIFENVRTSLRGKGLAI
ncbi:dTMP kinase [Synergistes jonesii]|uniref:dTMP kinase n=1 Tax=Synergistes jonesii TaxID=2754 RepID=UPI00248D44BD|nr:dTMP kinase [Synergistes jonesii]